MDRSVFKGSVRDSETESARDARMLALSEEGLQASVIAQRMSLSVNSVRLRIKRARFLRDRDQTAAASISTEPRQPTD